MTESYLRIYRNEHLLLSVFKTCVYIASLVSLVAILVSLPAGGHPPGIILVPVILGIWLVVIGILCAVYMSTFLILGKDAILRKQETEYPVFVLMAGSIILFVVVYLIYNTLPFAIYAPMKSAHYVTKLGFVAFFYTLLLGTALRQKWAYYITIAIMSAPLLVQPYVLIVEGDSIADYSTGAVIYLLVLFLIVISYMGNRKVKLHFQIGSNKPMKPTQ